MDNLLQKVPDTAIYLDDIVIIGKMVAEHDNNLRLVLSKLKDSGTRLKKSKCSFRQPSVEYLGHRVDSEGIHPTGKKYQAVQNTVASKNISELRILSELIFSELRIVYGVKHFHKLVAGRRFHCNN